MDFDKNRKLVMVVDDQDINLKIIDSMLEMENFRTLLINDPLVAVQAAVDNKPDLILLDVAMPVKSGFDVCEQLRGIKSTSEIPILFLSGNNTSDFVIKGLELGAQDYIAKPFNAAELLARVKTHIELRSMITKIVGMEQLKALNAAMVSQNHTLNQLITSVLGNIETLELIMEKETISDKMKHLIRSIEKAAEKMDETMRKFYNIKKVKYTKYSDRTDMLDLTDSHVEDD